MLARCVSKKASVRESYVEKGELKSISRESYMSNTRRIRGELKSISLYGLHVYRKLCRYLQISIDRIEKI